MNPSFLAFCRGGTAALALATAFCGSASCSSGQGEGGPAGSLQTGAGGSTGGVDNRSGNGGSTGSGGTNSAGTGGAGVGGSGAAGGAAGSGGMGGASGNPTDGGNTGRDANAGGRNGSGGGPAGSADGAATDGAPTRSDASSGPPVGPNPDPAALMKCTGTDPISCHFGGQPGNYDVTVVLGGAAAAGTAVQAETLRAMLPAVATQAGQTQRFTFTVNVRQPEGQPVEAVPAGTPGLDIYLLGNGGAPPALGGIGFAANPSPFMIYLAGDSTVCDQPTTDYGGWGQQLPPFFNYPVSIANYADSGESSGSFLASGSLFGAITSRLKAGDWVFIQFGYNDKDVTAATFHDNMTSLVTGVKAKSANPVLVTPVARATFSGATVTAQHINSTGANLPDIVRQVGAEQSVPVLDMTARTVTWLNQLGPNGWQMYHALGTDPTHTNPLGAAVEAGFVVDLIKQANLTQLIGRLR